MTKFTLNDWCKEMEAFRDGFQDFALFSSKNVPERDSYTKTRSLNLFVKKFAYFEEFTPDEDEKLRSLYHCEESDETFDDFIELHRFIEDLSGCLGIFFGDLYRMGEYDIISRSKIDTYSTLSKDYLRQISFPHVDYTLDEMVEFLLNSIYDYCWVKHKLHCQIAEDIIKILQSGGMPCGYKVTKAHEEFLKQEVEFLVFWPHKE
jgi:hypothetical protein